MRNRKGNINEKESVIFALLKITKKRCEEMSQVASIRQNTRLQLYIIMTSRTMKNNLRGSIMYHLNQITDTA